MADESSVVDGVKEKEETVVGEDADVVTEEEILAGEAMVPQEEVSTEVAGTMTNRTMMMMMMKMMQKLKKMKTKGNIGVPCFSPLAVKE
nr:unnamed protein product [Callosobruchus analis]